MQCYFNLVSNPKYKHGTFNRKKQYKNKNDCEGNTLKFKFENVSALKCKAAFYITTYSSSPEIKIWKITLKKDDSSICIQICIDNLHGYVWICIDDVLSNSLFVYKQAKNLVSVLSFGPD